MGVTEKLSEFKEESNEVNKEIEGRRLERQTKDCTNCTSGSGP